MKIIAHRNFFTVRYQLLSVLLWILLFPCLTGFDLSHHSVPRDQILDGGPAKDGIPAILQPKFVPAAKAAFLMPNDLVVGVFMKGSARAYPLKILNWHEVVDDAVAGRSFAVTYCPLTASAIVYNRELGTRPLMSSATSRSHRPAPSCGSRSSAGATNAARSSSPAICPSMSGPVCSPPSA